ncbi:hypothetical protein AB0K27_09410, partial [Micromonospora echinospora]
SDVLECDSQAGTTPAIPGATVANNLIVMTWNVENLFPPDDTDTSAADTYTAKLTYLTGLIAGTGADVVALQEIGSLPGRARPASCSR